MLAFALVLVLLACAGAARAAGLWVNLSGSMPIGIYRTVQGPIARGAIDICAAAGVGQSCDVT